MNKRDWKLYLFYLIYLFNYSTDPFEPPRVNGFPNLISTPPFVGLYGLYGFYLVSKIRLREI